MLFNDLFESDREPYQQAIDKLEVSRINTLNAKMDDLSARARVAHGDGDHDLYNALKREWTKVKAERDSIYGIREGTPEFTVECDAEGNASVIDRIGQAIAQFTAKKYGSTAFDASSAYAATKFKSADINDIAGWENAAAKKRGPVRLKPVVKKQPAPQEVEVVVSEWKNSPEGADQEQTKLKKVGIVRQKSHRMSEGVAEGLGDTIKKAAKYAMGGARVNNAIRRHDRKHDAAFDSGDYTTAGKEIRRATKIDQKFHPGAYDVDEGSMADASNHATGPKFGGYYKGTQVGAPRPGQSFGAESVEMDEAIYRDPGSFISLA